MMSKSDQAAYSQIEIDVEIVLDHMTQNELYMQIEYSRRQRTRLRVSTRRQLTMPHRGVLNEDLFNMDGGILAV